MVSITCVKCGKVFQKELGKIDNLMTELCAECSNAKIFEGDSAVKNIMDLFGGK